MLEIKEEIKRIPIELNLAAAAKRKRSQTGFIHYCYESIDEHDTIPIYENFCLALALFRSRLTEQVLEAKKLVERLLPFEVHGNFPVYLHEFPQAKDRCLSLHLLPVIHWILKDFQQVLGEPLKAQLEQLFERIVDHGRKIQLERPVPSSILCKWKACTDPYAEFDFDPKNAEEWGEWLVAWQVASSRGRNKEGELESLASLWNPHIHTFIGRQSFEKNQPETTLLDIGMGLCYKRFSDRSKQDHPIHLQASLVQPFLKNFEGHPAPIVQIPDPYTLLWGNQQCTHSIQFSSGKGTSHATLQQSSAELMCRLSTEIPPEGDERMECAFYCNLSPSHQIFVNGVKASTFQVGDTVTIKSEGIEVDLTFALTEGEGVFFGHILQGNRLSQKSCKGNLRFHAYDWIIALRTVGRTEVCALNAVLTTRSVVSGL